MDDDAGVVIDKAPYPDNGEAGSAAAEATGEDGEGGALVMPTTTMTMNAADLVTKQVQSTSFVNFAVDGVSLETKDVMTTICNFLSGCCNFTGVVDNKHSVKNDKYQIIGGSGVPLVGNYVADVDLIRQAGVPEDLWIAKDFASDK